MKYPARMRAKKQNAVHKLLDVEKNKEIPTYSPFKKKYPDISMSFVRRRSGMVRKLLTKKPTTAIPILRHVWDQLYKLPEMHVLMNQYWRNDRHLANIMLNIGKHKARKDDVKLLQAVNKVKQKYNSLHQACRLAISWSTFHRHTYIKLHPQRKIYYICKLSKAEIDSIQQHYQSGDVSFPLPDKKCSWKRFLRFNLKKCTRMYNMYCDTTRKISAATYHRYKPKSVQLQGCISFRQSCCE